MDCQSGCTLKSVNFAYLPEANLDSECPDQGSASMWALMEGRRGPHDKNSQRFAVGRRQPLRTPFLFISSTQPRRRVDANAK